MSYVNKECRLTTFDNPFDPFEDFVSWELFDKEKGYNSSNLLARITKDSDDLSQLEKDLEIERAIDQIIKYDFMGIYKKVVKETTIDDEIEE